MSRVTSPTLGTGMRCNPPRRRRLPDCALPSGAQPPPVPDVAQLSGSRMALGAESLALQAERHRAERLLFPQVGGRSRKQQRALSPYAHTLYPTPRATPSRLRGGSDSVPILQFGEIWGAPLSTRSMCWERSWLWTHRPVFKCELCHLLTEWPLARCLNLQITVSSPAAWDET